MKERKKRNNEVKQNKETNCKGYNNDVAKPKWKYGENKKQTKTKEINGEGEIGSEMLWVIEVEDCGWWWGWW